MTGKRIWLEETDSTNMYVRDRIQALEPMTLVLARTQTAGRGQRGNSWESEPGMNLTFSFHFSPERTAPAAQFAISEAVALAMAGVLCDFGIEARVKWPNDIYVGDRKISGILIENSIMGSRIDHSIVGIGLNVNQKRFVSDAPNPVSMSQLTGLEYDLDTVADSVATNMERHLRRLADADGSLHREYLSRLWRGDGRPYPFRETATGELFEGVILDVAPTGHLLLQTPAGPRSYAFKEITFRN